MDRPESFEVQQYEESNSRPYETYAVVKQIVKDYKDENPVATHSFNVDFKGDLMVVTFNFYEMRLPERIRDVMAQAASYQKQIVSHLKKEFKKRTRRDLEITEEKGKSDYTISKVSLNERYMLVVWSVYRVEA